MVIWRVTGEYQDTLDVLPFVAIVVTGEGSSTNLHARELVAEHIHGRWFADERDWPTIVAAPIGTVMGNEDGDGYVLEEGILSLSFKTREHPSPVQEPPHLWDVGAWGS